jgi:hypothetical protein
MLDATMYGQAGGSDEGGCPTRAVRPSRRSVLAALGALCGAAGASKRALAGEFYRGKTVTVIVGFAPGGGVDTTARVVAKHLVRFIPGEPSVIVQNMEGAGGVVAANHLDRRVAPDGLTLAVPGRSWFVEGIVKSPGVTFDPTKLTYIGSGGTSNTMLWVRASTGTRTFEELKSASTTLTLGALASNTPTAMVPLMLAADGAPLKVVAGYGSTARVLLAIEQGEVDGVFTVEDGFARRRDLVKDRVVLPLLQTKPMLSGIPLVRDVVPASALPLLTLVLALDAFGLPLVGPAGIPTDRVAVLRKAFLEMCDDEAYRADASKIEQPVGAPISGEALAAMMVSLAGATTPETIAAYRRLAAGK